MTTDSKIESTLTIDAESAYIDSKVISQMSDDVSAEMLPEMLELFVIENAKILNQIDQLLASRNIVELKNQSHALKGSAATFGAALLTPLAEKLEHSCQQGNTEDAEAFAKQVIEVGRKTLDIYNNRFNLKCLVNFQ
ncbi:MAG: Hpt domain-containing protein [Methylococcales bacterium]